MVTFIFLFVNIDNKNKALLYGTIFVFLIEIIKRCLIYYYNRKNL